jgi:hypothetical protein
MNLIQKITFTLLLLTIVFRVEAQIDTTSITGTDTALLNDLMEAYEQSYISYSLQNFDPSLFPKIESQESFYINELISASPDSSIMKILGTETLTIKSLLKYKQEHIKDSIKADDPFLDFLDWIEKEYNLKQ